MKLIIKKTDLLKEPCHRYDDLPDEFDAIYEIRKRGNLAEDVAWLISCCKAAQTKKILKYFKSLNPTARDVDALIKYCEWARTPEMIDYFKTLHPESCYVYSWITKYKFAQTPEMIYYYKRSSPPRYDIVELCEDCPYARQFFNQ